MNTFEVHFKSQQFLFKVRGIPAPFLYINKKYVYKFRNKGLYIYLENMLL